MTETLELEPDAFWRMVTQENLKVDGPSAGYMWTGKQGRDGWELYKTRAQPKGWLYQARRIVTQNAVGGGALGVRIIVPTGSVAKLVCAEIINPASAGATMSVYILDEDAANMTKLGFIAAGATRIMYLPSIGSTSSTHDNTIQSNELMIGPGQMLSVVASAALQTETLKVSITLLMSTETEPTWTTGGSAGTPVLAASTISAANTLQAVYL